MEEAQNRKFDKFWKQEEVWIRKGIEARRTRNEGRVRRLESLRRERAARIDRLGQVGFALDAGERSGKLVAELEHVRHGYGGRELIGDLSCRIMRGDKLGLIGPNGCGKTTLIRLSWASSSRTRARCARAPTCKCLFRPVPQQAGRRRRR